MHDVIRPVRKLMEAGDQAYPDPKTAELYQNLIAEEVAEFVRAEGEEEEFDACLDMIWVITGYMLAKGWLIKSGWGEVVRSNLSKIDPEAGKCIKREDGKVLKPASYSPPNLEPFLK